MSGLKPAALCRDSAQERQLLETIQEQLSALEAMRPPVPDLTRTYHAMRSMIGALQDELHARQPYWCHYDIVTDTWKANWRVGATDERIEGTGTNERKALEDLIRQLGERLHG
jgi:hypothetical protein